MIRIFLIIFFIVSTLCSQDNLVIKQDGDSFTKFNVKMYEDKNNSLTIDEIQKIDTFVPKSNRISNGYSQSTFWFTFKITNETNTHLHYFIQFTENFIDKLDCYVVSPDGTYVHYQEGPGYFKKGRQNILKKPIFGIDLQTNKTKMIYIKMFSLFPLMTAFNVMNKDTLHHNILKHNTVYALYFGAIIALILYNLFIFIFSKNIAYLFYILYAMPFLGWQMKMNGFFPFDIFSSTFQLLSLWTLNTVLYRFSYLFYQRSTRY